MVAGVCSSGRHIYPRASSVVCHFPVPGPRTHGEWEVGLSPYDLKTPQPQKWQNKTLALFLSWWYLCRWMCGVIVMKYIIMSTKDKCNRFVTLSSLCSLSYLWTQFGEYTECSVKACCEGLIHLSTCTLTSADLSWTEQQYCICYEKKNQFHICNELTNFMIVRCCSNISAGPITYGACNMIVTTEREIEIEARGHRRRVMKERESFQRYEKTWDIITGFPSCFPKYVMVLYKTASGVSWLSYRQLCYFTCKYSMCNILKMLFYRFILSLTFLVKCCIISCSTSAAQC